METAKSLLNVVYYHNGKLFDLCGGQHRRICLKFSNRYIGFEENASKTLPHVGESVTVLDSGFHTVDSGFRVLDSGFQLSGFRIPKMAGFQFFFFCWIPDSNR